VYLVGILTLVELDKKGRILLPAEVRKNFKTRRFALRVDRERIELLPMPDLGSLRGKYKSSIKPSWGELEERAEQLVIWSRR